MAPRAVRSLWRKPLIVSLKDPASPLIASRMSQKVKKPTFEAFSYFEVFKKKISYNYESEHATLWLIYI